MNDLIDGGAFEELQRQVIQAGLCTACGACIAVCAPRALRFGDDLPEPMLSPSDPQWPCTDCGRCLELCPALHVPMSEHLAAHAGPDARRSPALGTYVSLMVARATDAEIHRRGASGGVGVALQLFLVSTGVVQAAITTAFEPDRPWQAMPFRASTREQLLRGSQTKYQPSPVCSLLHDDEAIPGPLVLAGLPCHLHGLRKLQQSNALASASAVRLAIGLFCGGMWSLAGTRKLLTEAFQVPLANVRSIAYRDGEFPGSFRLVRRDGEMTSLPYPGYFDLGLRQSVRPVCKLCFDATAEMADISIGDIGQASGRAKWSAVILRTKEGVNAFEGAVEAGYLIAEPIAEHYVAGNYSVQRKKDRNLRHILAARERGEPTLDYPAPGHEPPPWRAETEGA